MTSPNLTMAAKGLRLKQTLRVPDLGRLLLRPIEPQDEPLLVKFHQALSEETIYQRYFEHIVLASRVGHERLARICTNDDGSFALVAVFPGTTKKPAAIFAVGRFSRTDAPLAADFALLVHDRVQGHGIGSALMKRLVTLARAGGFRQLTGEVLVANHDMLHVCRHFGFTLQSVPEDGLVRVTLDL